MNAASPAYLARHGTPRSPADLDGHALVHYAMTLGARADGFTYEDRAGAKPVVRTREMAGVLTVNNVGAYRAACLAGLGIVQAPAVGLQTLIAEGKVVEILPRWRPPPMPVAILYAHRRGLTRRLRAFMDWIDETLAPYLDPPHGGSDAR